MRSENGPYEVLNTLSRGDVIEVTVRGAVFQEIRNGNELVYTTLAGGKPVEHSLHLGQGWPGHTVIRVAPPAFPPQPGDLWRTWTLEAVLAEHLGQVGTVLTPQTWVARKLADGPHPDRVMLHLVEGFVGDDGDDVAAPHEVAKGSAKTPELVFRIGDDTTHSPAGAIYDVPGTDERNVMALQQDDYIVFENGVRRIVTFRVCKDGVELALASVYSSRSSIVNDVTFTPGDKVLVVTGEMTPAKPDDEVW